MINKTRYNISQLKDRLSARLDNINNYEVLLEISILIFCFFSLFVITKCGYFDDDRVTSLGLGTRMYLKQNLVQYIYLSVQHMVSLGRLQIISAIFLITIQKLTLDQYMIYLILSIIFNVYLFGIFIYQLTKSVKIKLLSMITITLFFQVYVNFHTSMISYGGMIQWLFTLLLITFIFYNKYYKTQKAIWFILSIFSYVMALLIFEVAYVFLPIILFYIFYQEKKLKKTFIYGVPYITSFSILMAISFYIRKMSTNIYTGAQISFNFHKVIATFLKQFTASIPLTNLFCNNPRTINYYTFLLKNIKLEDCLLLFVFLIIFITVIRIDTNHLELKNRDIYFIFILGFLIVAGPSGLMSLSQGYQLEIRWGAGHIPVYIEYFGLLLMAYAFIVLVSKLFMKIKYLKPLLSLRKPIFIFFAIIILIFNQTYARVQISMYNEGFYYPMKAMSESLKLGITNNIEGDSEIINCTIVPTYLDNNSYSSYYFATYSKLIQNVIYKDDYFDKLFDEYKDSKTKDGIVKVSPTKSTYIIKSLGNEKSSACILGKVNSIYIDCNKKSIIKIEVDNIEVYSNQEKTSIQGVTFISDKGNSDNFINRVPISDFNVQNSMKSSYLYKYVPQNYKIDFDSIQLVI